MKHLYVTRKSRLAQKTKDLHKKIENVDKDIFTQKGEHRQRSIFFGYEPVLLINLEYELLFCNFRDIACVRVGTRLLSFMSR